MSTPKDPENPHVDDETWLEIVARLEATPTEKNDGDTSLFAEPTNVPPQRAAPEPTIGNGELGNVEPGNQEPNTLGGPRDFSVAEPVEEEKYNPEVNINLGASNPLSVLAWVGLVASVLAAVVILFLRPASSWWFIGAVLVFLGSAGLLVWQMPTQRGRDDDGAQV